MTEYLLRVYVLVTEEHKDTINKWIQINIDPNGGEWLIPVEKPESVNNPGKEEVGVGKEDPTIPSKAKTYYHCCAAVSRQQLEQLVKYLCDKNQVLEESEWSRPPAQLIQTIKEKRSHFVVKCNLDLNVELNTNRDAYDWSQVLLTSNL